MRRVRSEVSKKWFVTILIDKFQCRIKKHIGAVAFLRLRLSVSKIGVVVIVVTPQVGSLCNATTAVNQRLLKATMPRHERIVVSKVPLAEDPGCVTVVLKHFRHGQFIFSKDGTAIDRVPDAGPTAVATGHQRRAGFGTRRIDMKIRHSYALRGQFIQVRRLQHGVAIDADIAVAHVIGHDQNDVGFPPGIFRGC